MPENDIRSTAAFRIVTPKASVVSVNDLHIIKNEFFFTFYLFIYFCHKQGDR